MEQQRYIKETFTNVTEGTRFAEPEPYPTSLTPGQIFRWARSEYGRCIGSAFNERRVRTNEHGGERWETIHVGWVFQSRDKYSDTGESYLREVWVTLLDGPPTTTVEFRPHSIGRAAS